MLSTLTTQLADILSTLESVSSTQQFVSKVTRDKILNPDFWKKILQRVLCPNHLKPDPKAELLKPAFGFVVSGILEETCQQK